MQIGFAGLGNLGMPIAQNLLLSGHKLFVYNRTFSKAESLAGKGATPCKTIGELAEKCGIIFTMVSDDRALKELVEGPHGIMAHAAQGLLHISMSTISPQTAKEMAQQHAEHHQQYLAAPVFGRPEAALARKMNVAISGNQAAIEEIQTLLKDAGASGVWNFGADITAANTVKLCGNFLIGSALEAIGESSALARKSGIDPEKMWEMFTQTLFSAPVYQNYSRIILHQLFEPAAFSAKLGLKDIHLVLDLASASGQPMPLASLLQEHLQKLIRDGKEQTDWSAMSLAASDADEEAVF